MKNLLIFGGSGWLGSELTRKLVADYRITIVSRFNKKNTGYATVHWDYVSIEKIIPIIEKNDIVINLTGANISSKRWTDARKQELYKSRINTSRNIVEAINQSIRKPVLYIQGSAIGYYNTSHPDRLTETRENGKGFISELTADWENSIFNLNKDVRRALIRTGLVIGKNSILLKKVKPLFRIGFGGHIGNGRNFMSWIHIDDWVNAVKFIIDDNNLEGPINLTAPNPVQSRLFFKEIGVSLNRKSWFHVPSFLIKLIYGEMGRSAILSNQKVIPQKLSDNGFVFRHSTIGSAVKESLDRNQHVE
jgi:uncharacterized protein (TIGR01777 family)